MRDYSEEREFWPETAMATESRAAKGAKLRLAASGGGLPDGSRGEEGFRRSGNFECAEAGTACCPPTEKIRIGRRSGWRGADKTANLEVGDPRKGCADGGGGLTG